jgi:hypothetical protein
MIGGGEILRAGLAAALTAVLPVTVGNSGAASEPTRLSKVWKQTARDLFKVSEPLSARHFEALRERARALFLAAAERDLAVIPELDRQARSFGLEALVLRLRGDDRALGLVDRSGGRGGCVARAGGVDAEVLLQAPHRFFDRSTGTIARAAFEGASLRGLCFATAHRYAESGGKPNYGAASGDLAHQPRSHFTAMTLAGVSALPGLLVVQLHGFAESQATAEIDAIVSPGPSKARPEVQRAAEALRRLGARTRVFPDEIETLGGTLNAQGKALAARGKPFLHIELGAAFRKKLADRRQAAALGAALARAFATRISEEGEASR